jgi:hypothetical protein
MKVPDTLTFSHEDIYNSVNSHAPTVQRNLTDLFAKADPNFFDPAYAAYTGSLRFRNYDPTVAPNPVEFAILYGTSGTTYIGFIRTDGATNVHGGLSFPNDNWTSKWGHYSNRIGKWFIMNRNTYYMYVNAEDPLNLPTRQTFVQNGTAGRIGEVTGHYVAGVEGWVNGWRESGAAGFSNINLNYSSIISQFQTVQTTGNIRRVVDANIGGSTNFFYCTHAGDIGRTMPLNGSLINQRIYTGGPSFDEMLVLNNTMIAFQNTQSARWASTGNMFQWNNFIMDSGHNSQIILVRRRSATHSLALSNSGRLYAVTHAFPPVATNITANLTNITAFTVASNGDIYAAQGNQIYRKTDVSGSSSWVLYKTSDLSINIRGLWFY